MRLLEATLRGITRLVKDPPDDGILTRVRPLSEGTRLRLMLLMEAMQSEIAAVVRAFDLQADDEWLDRRIDAEMSGAWSDLHEVLSGKLKRYGDVDPRLSRVLDPHIRRLIRMTLEAGHLARNDKP